MVISARTKAIIDFLRKSIDYVPIQTIAHKLKVTERTVYREIPEVVKVLRQCQVKLETVQGKGMFLKGEPEALDRLGQILQDKRADYDVSSQDRIDLTIIELLNQEDYIKTQAVAIQTKSSLRTSRNDLKLIEQMALNHNLKLQTKKGEGIYLSGDPVFKHHLLVSVITRNVDVDLLLAWMEGRYRGSQVFLDTLQLYGYAELFQTVYLLLKTVIDNKNIRTTDVNFLEFVMLAALLMKRTLEGKRNYDDFDFTEQKSDFYEQAKKIKGTLEKQFHVTCAADEFRYLLWLMHLSFNPNINGMLCLRQFMLAPQMKKIISLVEEQTGISFRNDITLLKGLSAHMDKALTRIRSGMSVINPINKEIQDKYGDLYWVVKNCMHYVFPEDQFPEDEIGYLVLYFAVSVDKFAKGSFRVLVVCSSGMGSSKMLASRLEREIPEIYIKKIISLISLPEEDLQEYDLILSTIPIMLDNANYMRVSPLLNHKELEKIQQAIQRHKHRKLRILTQKKRMQGSSSGHAAALQDFANMKIMAEWSLHMLASFDVLTVTNENMPGGLIDFFAQQIIDAGIAISFDKAQEFITQNINDVNFIIPNTQLSYLDCCLPEVSQPKMFIYNFSQAQLIAESREIKSVVLLLYPAKRSDVLGDFIGNMIMWIIEEVDMISLVDIDQKTRLSVSLGQRMKQYIIENFQERDNGDENYF